MRFCRTFPSLLVIGCLFVGFAWAQTPSSAQTDKSISAMTEMMRKDIRTEKQSMVDQAMGLEAAQKAQFWGIYDRYQKELSALWDQRIANIQKYADNYDKMTDDIAGQLGSGMLDMEQKMTALKRKYFTEYKTAMGPKIAARFLQTEITIGHLIDLQIAAQLPIIQ
jgi:hypothetical protein